MTHPIEIEPVIRIAREAGALLLEGFRQDPGARTKSRSDLVTDYDLRCELLLRERLAAALPGSAIVGEEEGGEPGEGFAWYVDPIDGTNNYAHGHPWFCVSIGLYRGDEGVLGVIHAPAMGLTYAARAGEGLTRNGEPARVSEVDAIESALMATGFPNEPWIAARNNYREFVTLDARSHGVRRCASAALELAMVAEGAYDGFWDQGLAPWDLAAGTLLVREGGGHVSALDGAPFSIRRGGVIATNGRLHAELEAALRDARDRAPIREA